MPRATSRSLAAALAFLAGCATSRLPAPNVIEGARTAQTYSASLRVSLKGPEVRARSRALVAFERPEALRLEVPGPGGLRLVAVTQDGALSAVFPAERAVYEGPATADQLEALLGVALAPGEVMDLLLGVPSPRLRAYRAQWGTSLPRKIEATLPDGARLVVIVDDAEAGVALPEGAFVPPAHAGYRRVDASEARSLWR